MNGRGRRAGAVGAIALALLATGSAAFGRPAHDLVRVGLFRYRPPHELGVSAARPWRARAGGRAMIPGGRAVVRVHGAGVELDVAGRAVLAGPEVVLTGDAPWRLEAPGVPGRRYAGELSIRVRDGGLLPVLALPLEDYVAATTGDEMPADWPAMALGAQAIASRSYATATRGRHADEGYDFCDLTHCQLFRGLAARDPRVAAAATATRGRVLTYQGRAIPAVWHSACGGELAANDEVFGGAARPYLRSHADRDAHGRPWCAGSPYARGWRKACDRGQLKQALVGAHVLAPEEAFEALEVRDAARDGVPLAVRVQGNRPHTLTGYALWMALGPAFGWGELASPRFTLASNPRAITFQGRGLGHLVGMCQWGARGRAEAGQSWQDIVKAYFPSCAISP